MPSAANPAKAEPWNETRARAIAARHGAARGGLLPALHDIQSTFGHVPGEAVALLADVFNVSRAEIHGVLTFYHDFRDAQAGRHVLKLCRAEACQAVGAVAVADAAQKCLKLGWGETSADGNWTLEPTFCLGLCASGPSAMLDGKLYARLDEERVKKIIEETGE